MTPLAAAIDALVRELAAQQLLPDEFWRARLASILERVADLHFQRGETEAAIASLPAGMREAVAASQRFDAVARQFRRASDRGAAESIGGSETPDAGSTPAGRAP